MLPLQCTLQASCAWGEMTANASRGAHGLAAAQWVQGAAWAGRQR